MTKLLFRFCLLAILATPPAAFAAPGKNIRVAILMTTAGPMAMAVRDGIARRLQQDGVAASENLTIEIRSAEGKPERFPELAKALASGGFDVIVTGGYPAARAAKNEAAAVPTVSINTGDPVQTGLAASLNRPGGNVTGISDLSAELSAKRLEILKTAVPNLKRVAMLWNADDLGMSMRYKAADAAAAKLGVAVQPLGVREPDDFATAFAAMTADKPDGILMVTDVLTILNRKRVFEFAAANRLPAIYEFDNLAADGGLMSYGPDGKETIERVAELVERIVKGAKPADLPFEQPTRFRFVVNLKTAKATGFEMPQRLIDIADEVIE